MTTLNRMETQYSSVFGGGNGIDNNGSDSDDEDAEVGVGVTVCIDLDWIAFPCRVYRVELIYFA